jgi:hypothetical protein
VRSFVLGLQLLRSTGRRSRFRLVLMALGAAIAAFSMVSIAAIPEAASRQDDRFDAQQLRNDEGPAVFLATHQDETIDGRFSTRIAVSVPDTGVEPPPWLDRFPDPGEIAASPALIDLIDNNDLVGLRYPQTVIQTLDQNVLIAPNQLLAVVGVDQADLAERGSRTRAVSGFGVESDDLAGPDPRAIRLMALGIGVFVVVPTIVLMATSARLSARSRERRLAALRLIGITPTQARIANSVEIAAITLVGALAGTIVWYLFRPVSQHIGIGPIRWWAADLAPSAGVVAAIVAGLAIVAVVVARIGSNPAIDDPLAERHQTALKPPSRLRLVPLAAGLGCLFAAMFLIDARNNNTWFAVFGAGNALTGLGLITSIPFAARSAALILERFREWPSAHLAARRLQHEPTAIARTVAGLLLVVFLAGFAQALIVTLDWATSQRTPDARDGRTRISTSWASFNEGELASINGVESFISTALIDLGDGPSRIVIGTCGDLERYASRIVGVCEPDTIQFDPGTSFDGEMVAQLGPVGTELRATIDLPDGGSTVIGGLLPPDLLPDGAVLEYDLDLAPGADLEAVGAALVRAAPGISISGIDSPDRGRLISTYTSLITAATIVAILLSLAATLAAVADRSLERRRHAAHLTALGLPPNTLRNAETLTLVAPLAIGIVAAGLATVFSALTYFQLAESPIELPVSSVAIIFGIGGVGAALTAITAYTTTSVTHPRTALRTE